MKAVKICADLFVMLSICQVATAVLQKIDNSQPPGTDADYHIEYNCANDPMGCQNMCYYYYCLGRSNYLTDGGDKKINRYESGYRHKPFVNDYRSNFSTDALSTSHQTADEYPPANSKEGGQGASLVGHDKAYKTQGARMKAMWTKMRNLNQPQGWVEVYNWDPTGSPACNCKPNWPEHTYYNSYGNLRDCGNDPRRKYIYRMTKDKSKTSDAEFENWDPAANWQTSPWNYKGYFGVKKREVEASVNGKATRPEQGLPKQVEASTTADGNQAVVSAPSQEKKNS